VELYHAVRQTGLARVAKIKNSAHSERPLIEKSFSDAEYKSRIIPMIYGYARVSTDGQTVDAQMKQLRTAVAEQGLARGVTRL
jgi:hypothetical protein